MLAYVHIIAYKHIFLFVYLLLISIAHFEPKMYILKQFIAQKHIPKCVLVFEGLINCPSMQNIFNRVKLIRLNSKHVKCEIVF